MASEIDTNVDNYTVVELLTILGLDYPDEEEIVSSSQKYIEKFELEGNEEMVEFFNDVQEALLEYAKNPEDGGYAFQPNVEQTDNWIQ